MGRIFLQCEICVKDYIIRLTNSIIRDTLYITEVKGMKKSVYSLVLMDDVIKAVDREACRLGTSRSNLINQILAERLSCVTPEMRMRDIFGAVSEFLNNSFQIQQQRSASLMTLKTVLDYKYRPAVNYKVELERNPGKFLGTLKVHIRTQSPALTDIFQNFFIYRAKLEMDELAKRGYDCFCADLSPGLYTRKLVNSGVDEEETGEAISQYLNNLNQSIQIYFSGAETFRSYAPQLEQDYRKILDKFVL